MTDWNHRRLRVATSFARRHERRLFAASHPVAYVVARAIRRRQVVRVPRLGIVVNSAVLAREVLLDPETFVKNGTRGASVPITQIFGPYALLNMEGPEHKQLRLWLRDLFSPKAARALTSGVRERLEQTGERIATGERVDVSRLGRLVSGLLMVEMTGVRVDPALLERRALEINDLSHSLSELLSLSSLRLTGAKLAKAEGIFRLMMEGVADAAREGDPTTIPGRLAREGLEISQIEGVVGVLMIAGTDTTSSAFARMTSLLIDSGQLARLRMQPELVGSAIDETLRFAAPVPAFTRTVARDCTLGGRRLRAGSQMIVFLMNGLRDRSVVDDPNVFDIARTMPRELRALWFGAGSHFCVGYAIASEVLASWAQVLAELDGDLRIVERTPLKSLLPAYDRLVIESSGAVRAEASVPA